MKIGQKVLYRDFARKEILEATVELIFTIDDCANKVDIGRKVAYCQSDKGSYPQMVFLDDLTIIEVE